MNSGVQLPNYSLKLVKRVIFRTTGFLDWLKTFLLDLSRKLPIQRKRFFVKVMLLKKNILIIFLVIWRICKSGAKQIQQIIQNPLQDSPKSNSFRPASSPNIEPKPRKPLGCKNIPHWTERSKKSGNKDLQTQDFHLTETTENPQIFSIRSNFSWIQDINKFKDKVFNKHLFKPHLDLSNNLKINQTYTQQPDINNKTNPEEKKQDKISISGSTFVTNFITVKLPTLNQSQSSTPSVEIFPIFEDRINIPPLLVPPDIEEKWWDSSNNLENKNMKS
jgi:hypothetical protein